MSFPGLHVWADGNERIPRNLHRIPVNCVFPIKRITQSFNLGNLRHSRHFPVPGIARNIYVSDLAIHSRSLHCNTAHYSIAIGAADVWLKE